MLRFTSSDAHTGWLSIGSGAGRVLGHQRHRHCRRLHSCEARYGRAQSAVDGRRGRGHLCRTDAQLPGGGRHFRPLVGRGLGDDFARPVGGGAGHDHRRQRAGVDLSRWRYCGAGRQSVQHGRHWRVCVLHRLSRGAAPFQRRKVGHLCGRLSGGLDFDLHRVAGGGAGTGVFWPPRRPTSPCPRWRWCIRSSASAKA